MIEIQNTRPEHIAQLVIHQQLCFPTLNGDDWMNAEMFAAQLRIFPDGQHVALDGNVVVGQSSTFRISEAIAFAPHTYREITAHNSFSNHDPQGAWLYGADMSIHPDYRGQGIATKMYTARKEMVRRLGMKGIVVGGALPGYHQYSDRMSVEEYVAEVSSGRLIDPTLTVQLKNGFRVAGILRNYVDGGELVNDDATLLVWEV